MVRTRKAQSSLLFFLRCVSVNAEPLLFTTGSLLACSYILLKRDWSVALRLQTRNLPVPKKSRAYAYIFCCICKYSDQQVPKVHLYNLGMSFTVSVFYFENIHAKKKPESLEQHFFEVFLTPIKLILLYFFFYKKRAVRATWVFMIRWLLGR